MKVKHELTVRARCPANGAKDKYLCIVETTQLIEVERILQAADSFRRAWIFQEHLCARLALAIGGDALVTLTGTHSGVKTTVRCYAYEA
jgi:hypothetical protein